MSRTWVLLRGLTREGGHWLELPARLRRADPGARVLTPDLPGNGLSHGQRSPSTVPMMTAAVRRDLAARGIEPPYTLLALSLGGMVAVDWADRHAEELAGAVLLNTSLRPFSGLTQRLRPGAWPALLRTMTARDAERIEASVVTLTSAMRSNDVELVRAFVRLRTERPVTRANALRQLVAAARFRAPANPPKVPMLVLAGDGDRLVDPRCSRAIAAAWGLPIEGHPTAGHDLALDAPEWVVERAVAWAGAGCRCRQ